MDLLTINSAITSAKALATTLQALAKLTVDYQTIATLNDAQQKVSEIQQQLFNTMQQLFEQQKELDELQQKLKKFQDWEAEKAQYKMIETPAGAFLWESISDSPQHYACPVCFVERKNVPLHKHGDYSVRCPACNRTYQLAKAPPTSPIGRRSIRFGSGSF